MAFTRTLGYIFIDVKIMYFFSEKSGDEEMCIEDPPLYKHIGILQVYMHNISRWFYKKKSQLVLSLCDRLRNDFYSFIFSFVCSLLSCL